MKARPADGHPHGLVGGERRVDAVELDQPDGRQHADRRQQVGVGVRRPQPQRDVHRQEHARARRSRRARARAPACRRARWPPSPCPGSPGGRAGIRNPSSRVRAVTERSWSRASASGGRRAWAPLAAARGLERRRARSAPKRHTRPRPSRRPRPARAPWTTARPAATRCTALGGDAGVLPVGGEIAAEHRHRQPVGHARPCRRVPPPRV